MTHWSLPASIGLTITVLLLLTYKVVYGAETINPSKIEYIGTSDWLNEVDKCVDLYQETEQNETLYYGCMNNLERVHYQ